MSASEDEPIVVTCAKQEEQIEIQTDGEISHCPGCGRGLR